MPRLRTEKLREQVADTTVSSCGQYPNARKGITISIMAINLTLHRYVKQIRPLPMCVAALMIQVAARICVRVIHALQPVRIAEIAATVTTAPDLPAWPKRITDRHVQPMRSALAESAWTGIAAIHGVVALAQPVTLRGNRVLVVIIQPTRTQKMNVGFVRSVMVQGLA